MGGGCPLTEKQAPALTWLCFRQGEEGQEVAGRRRRNRWATNGKANISDSDRLSGNDRHLLQLCGFWCLLPCCRTGKAGAEAGGRENPLASKTPNSWLAARAGSASSFCILPCLFHGGIQEREKSFGSLPLTPPHTLRSMPMFSSFDDNLSLDQIHSGGKGGGGEAGERRRGYNVSSSQSP